MSLRRTGGRRRRTSDEMEISVDDHEFWVRHFADERARADVVESDLGG